MRTRVLVADDHAMVRQGLVAILQATADLEVVGEAGDGQEALEKARALSPDVVLLDLSMPRLSGLEAARRLHEESPAARILVLTMHDDEEWVLRSAKAGVSGYLLKESAAAELVEAIRNVRAGRRYFGGRVREALEEAALRDEPREDPWERLTPREREVFGLIAEGRTNAAIAEVLSISAKTVDNHRTRLMGKLGLHGASDLVRFAARRGLLT